jgi:phage terminase large subunit
MPRGVAKVALPEWGSLLWEDFRHLGLYGGRAAAKSRTVAAALVIQSVNQHERTLCGREVQRSIRDSVKRLIEDEIVRLGLATVFDSTETEIRGPNESLFLFAGIKGNANTIKSFEGITTFWGEEAQTFSRPSIETVIPTIRAPRSRLIWTWNPDLETDPVDNLFRGNASGPNGIGKADDFAPPPRSIVRAVNHDENPWFPAELKAEMEYDQRRDPDKYAHVWLGKYRRNSEARVFRNWSIEAFETDVGAEFRFSIDPSCALRCWLDGRRIYVDHEAYGLNVEITNLPELFLTIPEAEKWWMTADSSRPETISHLRNHGFPRIRSAIKGARSVEEGIEFLKSYDIVVHPRCRHLIDELTLYSYKLDSMTGQVTPVLADKDNHMIDALRYAVEGVRRISGARPEPAPIDIPSLASSFR